MDNKKEIIPLSQTLCDEERLYLYAQRNHQLPAWAEDVL